MTDALILAVSAFGVVYSAIVAIGLVSGAWNDSQSPMEPPHSATLRRIANDDYWSHFQ